MRSWHDPPAFDCLFVLLLLPPTHRQQALLRLIGDSESSAGVSVWSGPANIMLTFLRAVPPLASGELKLKRVFKGYIVNDITVNVS